MTLLLKNVRVLGSDQDLPDKLDVFVNGKKISAIGRFPNKKADTTIDGQGAYLSPGFIDLDTESDHYLSIFTNPSQEDFLKQGVTTILGGLCGASLAPLIYGSLESMEEWTSTNQINVDWHTTKEFLDLLERRPLGVNFATLTGHTTIRQAIIGKVPRNLTKNEIVVFSDTIKKSIEDGSFGFSTGLGYAAAIDTPYAEIKNLVEIVAKKRGLYATHLRKMGGGLVNSVEETIKLSKDTGVKTIISHFSPIIGQEKEYEQAIESIGALPKETDFSFSLYPFKKRILKLYTFLPEWAQKDDLRVMTKSIQDEWLREKILKDLPEIKPDDFVVAQAINNDSLVGLSLGDIRKLYSLKSFKEALLKLMITTNLQAIIFYKNINEDLMKKALANPRSLIASNAASLNENQKHKALKPDRATSTFTRFLRFVEEEKILPIEEAIKKITLFPAQKLGLKDRGIIRPGFVADLTGFKNGEVNFVIVGGQVAVLDKNYTGLLGGKVLRSSD